MSITIRKNEKIFVSACLAGVNCKYDGGNNENTKIMELLRKGNVILVCPEQLGGLPTPRVPAERLNEQVVTKDSRDVTAEYNRGANEVLKLAKKLNIKKAILKSRSPSCGKDKIYDGTFSHMLTARDGVTAELLRKNGIEVYTEEDI